MFASPCTELPVGQAMYVFRTQGKQAIYYIYNEFNISQMGKYTSIFLLSTYVSVQYQMCMYIHVMKREIGQMCILCKIPGNC